MFFWVWAQKDFTSTENAFLKQAFNNAKMGHFQCLTVPQWAWAPPFFISKLKFPYDKYSVDKVWTKIYCHFYFRGITLSSTFDSNRRSFNYLNPPKLSVGSAHVKYGVWPGPKRTILILQICFSRKLSHSLRCKRSHTRRTKFGPRKGVINGARTKRWKEGGGGGERRERLSANPSILKKAHWFSRLS